MPEGTAGADAAAEEVAPEVRVTTLQKELRSKKTFLSSCRGLVEICERQEAAPTPAAQAALREAGQACFTVLQTRYSNPMYWQAGLEFFLALESACPEAAADATKWRDAAIEEVDEDAREAARQQAQKRKIEEERKHNQGRFCDDYIRAAQQELIAALVNEASEGSRRPGMSRDAQDELRMVTIAEEETCVVCQEKMAVGSKAKLMPCGHRFHDGCIVAWVQKNNSCPTCRFEECDSEKKHFDDVQSRIRGQRPTSGLYA